MIKFLPIKKEDILKYWDKLETHLNKAVKLDPDKYDIESIKNAAITGNYKVWVVFDDKNPNEVFASVATRILKFPKGNILNIEFVGGSRMKEWLEITHKTLEDYARSEGCISMQAQLRTDSVVDKIEKYDQWGWEILYKTYEKKLEERL